MREIKFRLWWKRNKVMSVTIDVWNLPDLDYTDEVPILIQFTGLKDKNEKEIYEGDIVGFGIEKPEGNRKCIIKDIKDMFFDETHCLNEGISDIFVIGNIYENPELLKNSVL